VTEEVVDELKLRRLCLCIGAQ